MAMLALHVLVIRRGGRAASNAATNLPLLTFFTKKNEPCSLCDDAKEILKKYSSLFVYEEKHIDVPENKEWFEKYRYHIPVIHLDGQFLMKHRVNERLLKEALHSKSTSTIQ
ncbi:hypothetical protein EMCRGX_G020624 [Ephydatia muelleri]